MIHERLLFNQMVQDSSESIHAFVVRLQTQSENCEYGDMRPELVRDRIVVGVRDSELRKYLIDTENLTLELFIQKAKQFISHQSQAEKIRGKILPQPKKNLITSTHYQLTRGDRGSRKMISS